MRKLAHIEKIESIYPIEGADKIEVAQVLGWECVVQKGEFKVGDKVIYIEVDSVLPEKPEYEFLRPKKFRIKTIKLKGQISQGLVLPLPEELDIKRKDRYQIGTDVTKELEITQYLSPSEKKEIEELENKRINDKNKLRKFIMRYSLFRRLFLSKKQKKSFPYWVSKTDEEILQNIPQVLKDFKNNNIYITEKIDYQSGTWTGKMTPRYNGWLGKILPKKYRFVVCSRNLLNNNKNSLYWQIAKKYNLEKILKDNPNITIQGEQGNTKIQGNKYGIKDPTMWVFNIIDHDKKYHYNYDEMKEFCDKYNLNIVPLLRHNNNTKLSDIGTTIEEWVKYSGNENSRIHYAGKKIQREGIVVRCIEDGKKLLSFKVINPNFLLKYNE